MLENLTIEQLVKSAQGGCVESFGELYVRYYSAMVAIGYSVLGDRNLAEDAAQESFAKAAMKLKSLRKPKSFGKWIGMICRNCAIAMQRANGRAKEFLIERALPDESDEFKKEVSRALSKLKRADREVLVLRYFDSLSYERMSDVLGISVSAVNGRIFRAKKKLKKVLEKDGWPGGEL